jgi:hypothetical protein
MQRIGVEEVVAAVDTVLSCPVDSGQVLASRGFFSDESGHPLGQVVRVGQEKL